jgi:ABC-type branched-subunit amino acid transport system substrate-binding protein
MEGAFILFGSLEGGPSVAVMKVASELNVPFIGPMAGSPTLRQPHQPYVFPVRAEHRDEFQALMAWGRSTGLKSVGFIHSDSPVGEGHLQNVRLLASQQGLEVRLTLPFKGELSDAQIDDMVRQIADKKPDMVFNHGSSGMYARLIRKARNAGLKTLFMGVNSGSTQIAQSLGGLANGMVFSQVVPNPRERKHPISREFQDAWQKAEANTNYSYGALEGYMTAKALVMALRAAGPELTRISLLKALNSARFDLGGVMIRYSSKDHEGSRFVDLSIVAQDGRFLH